MPDASPTVAGGRDEQISMAIRYKCDDCGSVLKIKDELAGTEGRCPKCKRTFTVPASDTPPAAEEASQTPADDAEFDPVAFLMDDGGPDPGSSPGKDPASPRTDPAKPAPPPETSEESEETDRPARQRRRPAAESATAAASAGAMLGKTASSNAEQLLTRSMEESRVRASQMPEEPEREDAVDYRELFRVIGLQALPAVAAILALSFGVYYLSSSWLDDLELPELGRVYGVVTKDGEPLSGAEVVFTPLDVDARSATAVTDENGEYEMYYLEGVRGAVVGKNRVEISYLDERGREQIQPRRPFGLGSNEIFVVEDGSQELLIDVDQPLPRPQESSDDE